MIFFAMRPRLPGGTTPGFPGDIETVVTLRLWGVGRRCPQLSLVFMGVMVGSTGHGGDRIGSTGHGGS